MIEESGSTFPRVSRNCTVLGESNEPSDLASSGKQRRTPIAIRPDTHRVMSASASQHSGNMNTTVITIVKAVTAGLVKTRTIATRPSTKIVLIEAPNITIAHIDLLAIDHALRRQVERRALVRAEHVTRIESARLDGSMSCSCPART